MAFFAAAYLGFALATVRFAALDTSAVKREIE
jgi:hypothetical protein